MKFGDSRIFRILVGIFGSEVYFGGVFSGFEGLISIHEHKGTPCRQAKRHTGSAIKSQQLPCRGGQREQEKRHNP